MKEEAEALLQTLIDGGWLSEPYREEDKRCFISIFQNALEEAYSQGREYERNQRNDT